MKLDLWNFQHKLFIHLIQDVKKHIQLLTAVYQL